MIRVVLDFHFSQEENKSDGHPVRHGERDINQRTKKSLLQIARGCFAAPVATVSVSASEKSGRCPDETCRCCVHASFRPQTPVDVRPIGTRMPGWQRNSRWRPWSADLLVLARGESVTDGPCNCFITTGWRKAQRYWKTFFELLRVLDVESGLKPSKRDLTSDYSFNFLEDFQAILYHKLYSPLREIIHLLSADPEEGLPVEFAETLQPRLFSSEEFDAVSLLLSQKLIQRKGGAAGVAKIPACNHCRNSF